MSANDLPPEPRAERLQSLHAASLRLFGLLTAQQPETALLQQAVESLAGLIGARYGAIGVLDDAGKLAQFVYTGITPEDAARIGRLPEGRGLLGAVIHENHVLRLDDMTRDPRAIGFPPHHPPMKSLLAAPVSHEGRIYGRVYLSEKQNGTPFSADDEQLIARFADALALTIRFHRAEAERFRAQTTLQNIAHAVSTVTGEEFFGTLVRDLAKALNVDYAFVGELAPGRNDAVRTLAVNAKGRLVANFTYELAGTPCNNVVTGKAPCLYASDVRQQFPDDHLLREMDVESYLGCPLFGSDGQLLGVLAILDSRPMHDIRATQTTLQICAARAAAELERLGAERQLRQSEQRQRALLRAVPDLLLRIRGDGTYLDFKPSQQFRTYVPASSFLGKKPADVLPPAIAEEHMTLVRRALTTGQAQVSRYRLDVDGAPRDYEARIVPSGEDEVLGIVRDVTEERRAAEQMRKLSSAIQHTADSVIITDPEGVIEYVNPAFERTTGYSAQEALGRKPSLVKSGLHDNAFYRRLWQTLREGKPFRDIFINRRKSGELYFEEKTITPLKDERGNIRQFVSTGKNITERMQAEIALRESERRYAELIEQAPDAIVTLDLKGLLRTLNPAAERLCGYRADELIGKHFAEAGVLAPESLARAAQEFPLVVAGEERPPFELVVLRKHGGQVFTEINPRLIRHNAQPAVVQVTLRDITERKRAEEALARAASEWIYSMDFMEDALYLIDLDDRVVRANRAFYRLTGLSPEQVIGRDISSLMHPQGETTPCPVCLARRERRDATIVMEADHPDNPTGRPIEVMVRVVRDAENRPASVLMGIRDLTRARQVETDLRQSRASLLEAQRMAQLGNWEWDLVTGVLTWSDETYRIFGRDPQHFTPTVERFLEAVHADDRARVDEADDRTLQHGEPFRLDFRIRRPDGTTRVVHEEGEVVRDPAGRPLRMRGTVQDITERRAAEEALRDSNALLENVFNNSHLLMAYLDPEFNFVRVNAAYAAAGGHEPDFYLGKNHFALYPNAENEIIFRRVVETGEPHFAYARPFEYPDQPGRGVTYWDWSLHPVKNAQAQVLGLVFLLLDVTERRRAELALGESEERFRSLTELSSDWYWEQDANYRFTVITRNQESAERFPSEETLGKTRWELPYFDVPPEVWEEHKRALAERRPFRDLVLKRHDRNNRVRYSSLNGEPVFDARGNFRGYRGTGRDITERMQALETLRANEARLAEAQRMAQLGNWELDLADNTLTWSDEIFRIFEIDPVKFGASYEAFLDAIHPDDRELVNRAYTESVKNRTPYDIEHRLRMKDGRIKYVHERCETFYDEAGMPLRSVGTIQDITERKRTEEQLNYLAYYDTLTGLPNRALLLERLRQATADADRVGRLVAVMFLDLDRFKYINDTLGHHAGDGLLKAVAERLQSCVRAGDTIARLGGDEFTIILSNVANVDDIARVARKLIDSFARPFAIEGRELFTTTSIGITLYPFDEREAEGLLKNADTAMYHAKERGRNTFQYFTAELNVRAERRLRIETALRQALERNELSLHYQPQVDLKTGQVTGMEALARWKHPELGSVSPVEFIPVAEETGLIVPLGEWVLREACRQIKDWHDTGFPKLQVAVNLSGKQLRQKDFPERVREILRDTQLESRYLDLELTESLLMVDTEETAGIMHALHELGVSFSVDDFGTGYSSLAYLKRFPIDVLKIDRSFVRDIATDPNDVAIVKTVIAMAHTLGMRVIAEGVETYEQLQFLRKQGCDGSQGYYCSEPVTAEAFTELLADWVHFRGTRCKPGRRSGGRRPAKIKSAQRGASRARRKK